MVAGRGEKAGPRNGAGEPDAGAEERPFVGLPVRGGARPVAQERAGLFRAFAEPVVLSNSGFVTANGVSGPDGYRNSYGYSVGPARGRRGRRWDRCFWEATVS